MKYQATQLDRTLFRAYDIRGVVNKQFKGRITNNRRGRMIPTELLFPTGLFIGSAITAIYCVFLFHKK